ncbi:MAG: 3-oxoacyl-ACP reductase [Acidocella sp. 20-63-7]|nr:MAG: 3-oxoacyl-ACP reductase [Acidocella sp. 20-63-7]HQT47309.1 SDR family oxidoreductase [Acidocella sp.]
MSARYPSLENRVVFITGGGSGIGAALTRAFAEQGAKVAFVDIAIEESEALAARVAQETGNAPRFIPCDIRDIEALRTAIAQVAAQSGAIDVLVNNAANDQRHDMATVTPEYWDNQMSVNLRPMFFAVQAVAPGMRARKSGSIINFGSVSWMMAQGGMPSYTAAKAAVHGLTRGLARDLGDDNIRVNTLIPGWVMTERQLKLWLTPEADAEREKRQCLKLRLQPEHLASMALFLAADDSAACSAQEFIVDAGTV